MTDRILHANPKASLAWLTERHSLVAEAGFVLALYALYEATRGLVAGSGAIAVQNADKIVSVERTLHVFVENDVQHAARAVPGLLGVLGVLYLTLHLAATGGYLLWLHRRRPAAFPIVRTTILIASALALIGYLAFPAAPPRLAGLGIADTISNGHINLNKGLISALYNPFAAMPSMHAGYAAVIGTSLIRHGGRPTLRVLGVLYPALILLVIVGTGNHFFLDAAVGAAVAGVAALAATAVFSAGENARGDRPAPCATAAPAFTER
jgi:membrane-associated phospholipid phosphatase